MNTANCNHVHVIKGRCVLELEHSGPHLWIKDVPEDQIVTGSDGQAYYFKEAGIPG